MIKPIIWMYGVFIIYVILLLVQIANIKSFVSHNKPFLNIPLSQGATQHRHEEQLVSALLPLHSAGNRSL